ncbi:glycosyltransferase family 2 protein [Paenibacillus sp.]|uniref:glycosyltransferase family 2 protein n=1 Tax=Paenibacillus sp. TaxID=58172 RepID=UPI002D6CA1C9|nr:glycosyltransferase family 2 protein [Paenibacillus sp.]HZG56770.1 glycosyltransferase family 2 protein [Paenibacillus sp.]
MLLVSKTQPTLAVVVPCFNEEAVLPETIRRIRAQLDRLIERQAISPDSFMLFVDDGSSDSTWPIIVAYGERDAAVRGVKLARNAGHQHALLAGLLHAKEAADCVISIDADLQDDVEAFEAFIERYKEGCEIVYGVRAARAEDTWFKRETANAFYALMKRMGTPVIPNHADYRLMSARAIGQLACYGESNLFLRGLIPQLGLRSSTVAYDRRSRFAGESKYPLRKMISFAWNGITSLSVAPIRLVLGTGLALFAASVAAGGYALYAHGRGAAVPGWTSMMLTAWLLGGIQLICLGVVGEYVGKVYKETKRRPRYFIEATAMGDSEPRSRPKPSAPGAEALAAQDALIERQAADLLH